MKVSQFTKQFQVAEYKIHIIMEKEPTHESNNTYIWGYPYYVCGGGVELVSENWTKDVLNNTKGYYFGFRVHRDGIEFVNDILGGYRVYYCLLENNIFISDNYLYLVEIIGKGKLTLNKDQYHFWEKHRYCLNANTLFNEIMKMSPCTIASISDNEINIDTYFHNCSRKPNIKKLMENNLMDLKDTLKSVYLDNPESKFVLFYSGGDDSTLLLLLCRELHIPVTCVIIKYLPEWSINVRDIQRAANTLKILNQEFDLVEVNINDAIENHIYSAASELLFDRHMAVHFYQTYQLIKERYGDDIVVINGQSADSILSFGPSEFTKGNMAKRIILAFSNGPLGFIGNVMSKALPRIGYVFPFGKKEACEAILDDTNYIFALDKKCLYKNMLETEIERINQLGIKQYEAMRMYAKIIGFLQGSDNQVVIKAARHNGINKIVMPFTSPSFIYNTIKYKNNIYEIFKPKYFVRDTLGKVFHYTRTDYHAQFSLESDLDMGTCENMVMEYFFRYLKSLVEIPK